MKKSLVLFTFISLFFAVFQAQAQNPIAKGQSQINAGLGLSSRGLPVYIGFDYGVHDDITVGAELSYRGYRESLGAGRYTHSIFGILVNGNYHFNNLLNISSEWDFYAGLNAGIYIWNTPNDYPGTNPSSFGLGAQIGGRYYFTEKLGVNLEFGGGHAYGGGKVGLSIKL